MRVLEVFGEPIASGGQEAFVFNVVKHMDRSGLELDFFTPYDCSSEYYRKMVEEIGGRTICAGLPFLPGQSRRNIIEPLQDCLMKGRYDTVHIHSGSTTVLAYGAYAARRCGVENVIVHSHCTNIVNLKYRLTKAYASFFFRRYPTQFCACSLEAGAAKFPAEIVRDRLQIINNGIELERFAFRPEVRAEYRKKLGLSEDTLVLGHVGRFSEQKNHRFDLQILEALLHEHPALDVKLLWIGEGELEQELRQRVTDAGLEDRVHFAGVVHNVGDYLQAMDVFLLPSLFEGLGIVGVEAQAAGLPVLVSEAVPRALQLTESVRYLPLGSPEDWAAKILEVRGERAADNIPALTAKGYSIQETAARVRSLYLHHPKKD